MFIRSILAVATCVTVAWAAPAVTPRGGIGCAVPSVTCGGGIGNTPPLNYLCDPYCHRIRGVGGHCVKDPDCWDWLSVYRCHCDGALAAEKEIDGKLPDLHNVTEGTVTRSEDSEEGVSLNKRIVCSLPGWLGGGILCEAECQKQGCSRGGHCDNQSTCRCNC